MITRTLIITLYNKLLDNQRGVNGVITIICSGSRGDFQPYIALAQELIKLGETVKIAGFSEFESFVRGYGVDFYSIEVDYEKLGVDKKLYNQAASADNPLKMLFAFNKMKKFGIQIAEQTYAAFEGSDLIVYHPGCTMGYFAAKEMGIPAILGSPFPLNKTQEYLSVISYGRNPPTSMNKSISYKMLQGMLWLASSDSVKGYWKKRYHRLPDNFGAPYERVSKKEPAIISCSNFVLPRPVDWSENIHQYGYWFVEEPAEFNPSSELSAFLHNGDKPVYIGFGSVFNADKKDESVKLIAAALDQCKMRGIISGMGDIENLPNHMIAIGSTPHSWLFEKCAAVCHHGGAGTTAAGFKAGVPSIVIPFANDQFAWAHRTYDLGVGAKPIYKKNLTASDLAGAIKLATSDGIIRNARKLSENISAENGAFRCAGVVVDALMR